MGDEQRVAAIRERAEAATEGPWSWWNLEGVDQGWQGNGPDLNGPADKMVVAGWGHDAWGIDVETHDAEFIAAAREDIPWLLDRLRAAEAKVAALLNISGEQERYIESLEARAAEAEAAIAGAPHSESCSRFLPGTEYEIACNCWKAAAASDALARVKAEAWDEGLSAGADRWMDAREFGEPPVNPYRAGADHE